MTTAAQPVISADSRPRIRPLHRAAYGLGDFAGTLVFTATVAYLPIFYTDAVGIAAGVVGILMLATRVFDAAIDPLIGALAERTRSRHGRFRPWVLYGMLPLAVFSVLTFTAPFPGHSAAAVVYATVTYGILGILYSAVNLPYGAIATVMAETSADRVSLSSARFVGAMLSFVLLGLVTVPLVNLFSHTQDGQPATVGGYTITVALYAVLSLPMLFAVFRTSRETITPVRRERVPVRTTIRVVVANRHLLVFFAVTLLTVVAYFGRLGVVIYYYQYNVGVPALVPILIALTPIGCVVGTLLFARFARRVGKRNLLMVCLAAQGLVLTGLYLVGAHNTTAVVVLTACHGLAGFSMALLLSMIADVIDYGEHKTGIRADGTTYALFSFSQKLAVAISGAAVGLLGAFGYAPNATQTAKALGGIDFVANLLPALVGVGAILVLLTYRLTDEQAAEIRNQLTSAAKAHPA